MESYTLGNSVTIDDLLARHAGEEKVFLFSGRRPKLAFQPKASLTMDWNDINLKKIKDFCRNSQLENNLIIGFFSYDLGLYINKVSPKNKTGLPLVQLHSFENWIEEDNNQTVIKYRDKKFLKSINNLANQPKRKIDTLKTNSGFKPIWNIERYKTAFERTKKYIESGDVYQINLSYPLSASSDSNTKDIFIQTQKSNQAEMAGLFQAEDFDLISLSPETFINITGSHIETFPIKGTRARGEHKNDVQIEDSLMHDEKEQAELNMISDLLRNDLSMVCEPNSVKLKSRRKTAKLSRVIHTYSHITGKLAEGISSVDALLKIFPGGSISGCPKKRALEIIDELEEYARGPYTGSLFTLDPEDNLEASILIRTLIKSGKSLSLPVGGGIVFDSKYSAEYQETLDKAASITQVFKLD